MRAVPLVTSENSSLAAKDKLVLWLALWLALFLALWSVQLTKTRRMRRMRHGVRRGVRDACYVRATCSLAPNYCDRFDSSQVLIPGNWF